VPSGERGVGGGGERGVGRVSQWPGARPGIPRPHRTGGGAPGRSPSPGAPGSVHVLRELLSPGFPTQLHPHPPGSGSGSGSGGEGVGAVIRSSACPHAGTNLHPSAAINLSDSPNVLIDGNKVLPVPETVQLEFQPSSNHIQTGVCSWKELITNLSSTSFCYKNNPSFSNLHTFSYPFTPTPLLAKLSHILDILSKGGWWRGLLQLRPNQ